MFFPASQKEQLTNALNEAKKYETQVRSMCAIDESAYHNHFDRRSFDARQEQAIEATLTTELEMADVREYRRMQIERLAGELDRHNRDQLHEQKMRQQVRANSQELKELEIKLRAAYVGKGIRAQLAEKEAKRLQDKLDMHREQEKRLQIQLADEEHSRAKKAESKVNKVHFRQALQDQILNKQQSKQLIYEEFLREKKEIDEMVRRIYDEQMAELQEKCMKRDRFRADLEELKKSQAIWNQRQQDELKAENHRIMVFLEEREQKIEAQKKIDAEKRQSCSQVSEKLGTELLEIEEKKRQREELLLLLKVEELEEKTQQKIRARLEKQLRSRLEIRIQLDRQRQDNIARKIQEQDDDRQIRQKQMEILAERDKIEQLTTEKRRQRLMEHNKIVRGILEANKERRAHEIAGTVHSEQLRIQEQERLQQIIEEERIKILKEHASELIGFFPPGVLRESDRSILNL